MQRTTDEDRIKLESASPGPRHPGWYVYRWTPEQKAQHVRECGPHGEEVEHYARGEVLWRGKHAAEAQVTHNRCVKSAEPGYEYGWTTAKNTIFQDDRK